MTGKIGGYVITWSAVALALAAAVLLYWRWLDKPWTRDAQVRANIVGIAPRVAGPIINIPIKDNQAVARGDLLFEIDPSTYQAEVNTATGRLKQAEAAALQTRQELDRQTQLYQKDVIDIQDLQNAQDAYEAAIANVAAARAQLDFARLNLSYTKVFAPVDGYLTNINTSPGTYVHAGQQLLALVDGETFWIAAYFKETQLGRIQMGDIVDLALMGYHLEPFEGVVRSIGWGIFLEDGATVDLLPQVRQTVDWVRLPQRFPVRIHVTGEPPVPLRIGQTVSVAIRQHPSHQQQ